MEKTRLSEQYFPAVQKFVVFDLGLSLLPVSGQTDASQLITQMVRFPECGEFIGLNSGLGYIKSFCVVFLYDVTFCKCLSLCMS